MEDTKPKEPENITSLKQVYEELYKWAVATFPSPANLMAFYDKDLQSGGYSFYPWQVNIHNNIFNKKYTDRYPLELALVAVNGSGKDKLVITPFSVWSLLINKDATVILTSASGTQLTNQTETDIRKLCQNINATHGYEIFDVKQRHVKCVITGSEMFMFATDEAGKAEGYHPISPNKVFIIIVNEAKSVKEEIYEALQRCTGFTHKILISSPGKPDGYFYRYFTSTRLRLLEDGTEVPAVKSIRVVSDDCPHLGGENFKRQIAEDSGGVNSHVYKSMVEAEFSTTDEEVVLSSYKFDRCIKFPPEWIKTEKNRAGLDLSGGGDEQVLTVVNGNKIIAIEAFRIKDAVMLLDKLIKTFEKYQLQDCIINADAGNMGKTIIDLLHGRGWKNVRYIWNQSTPKDELAYANKGTEMWFNFSRLVENQEIILHTDELFRKQVCNRYYKFNADNTAQLESKPQAKSKGHPSPDRADSVVLAFLDYKTPKEVEKKKAQLKKFDEEVKQFGGIPTIRKFTDLALKRLNNENYRNNNGIISASPKLTSQGKNSIRKELLESQNRIEQYFKLYGKNN